MAPSDIIALAALGIAVASPVLSSIRVTARRDGKLDAAIEQLTRITGDHEDRLRRGGL